MRFKLTVFTILLFSVAFFAFSALGFYSSSAKNGKVLGESTAKIFPIKIIEDGIEKKYFVNNPDLKSVLDQTGIKLFKEDKVVVNIRPEMAIGSTIIVRHATQVFLIDKDSQKEIRTFSETVEDVLKENKVVLKGSDFVEPAASTHIKNGQEIKIIRVKQIQSESEVSVAYETEKKDDPNTWYGSTSVLQAGKNGSKKIKYLTTYHNDQYFNRKIVSENIVEKPVTKIIGIGTKRRVLSSVYGVATATNLGNAVVSATYPRGTLIRITNLANGVQIIKRVNYTWGTATPPPGVVLDLSWSVLDELGFNYVGRGPNVLVEHII